MPGGSASWMSLDHDPSTGEPALTFLRTVLRPQKAVYYAWRDAGAWHVEEVDRELQARNPRLAFHPTEGHPSIAYFAYYAGSYEGMSDETAKRLVDDYLAIQGEHVALMKSYLPRLRKVLPEKKVARYYQLENKIRAVVDYELAAKIPLVK